MATDVAARGLDIKGVVGNSAVHFRVWWCPQPLCNEGLVINFDPANNTEESDRVLG